MIKQLKEGERIPKFYIPVYWHNEVYQLECWLFLFAPLGWMYYLSRAMFRYLVRDIVDLIKFLEFYLEDKDAR